MNRVRVAALLLPLLLAGGCGMLGTKSTTTPPSFYALDGAGAQAVAIIARSSPAVATSKAPTLIVNPPHAAAGFDSRRIIYQREIHKREYFAHNEWVDTPARMLAPLLVAALEKSGAFRAVVLTPSAAVGDLRLDTEIVRLQHEFGAVPSRVRFTLRAYLVDVKTRRVLAWREFDAAVDSASEDPRGGVLAANSAVQGILAELAAFCAEAARLPVIAAGG